jgi:hypothetical protein
VSIIFFIVDYYFCTNLYIKDLINYDLKTIKKLIIVRENKKNELYNKMQNRNHRFHVLVPKEENIKTAKI